jgi:hypothetical protein
MTLVDVVHAFLLTKGWTAAQVFQHRAPANQDTICLTTTTAPRWTNDGKANFREGYIEAEICRKKIKGTDITALDFTVEKLKTDLVGLMRSNRIIRVICDREAGPNEGPGSGFYYYSIWFLVTLDLGG